MKIGIDLGTTNTKAIALSDTDEAICESSLPTKTISGSERYEIDPGELASDLFYLLKKTISESRTLCKEPLTGLGLTGMAEAGCLVDRHGEPVIPIMLWYDQRGAEEAEELRKAYEDILTSISGIRMSNVATIYKLSFLQKHMPFLSGSDYRWFGVPEWAAWKLTGRFFTDRTLAVRTGAYSLKTNEWSQEILDIIRIRKDLFPEIIPVSSQNYMILPETAADLGIPTNVRVTVSGHDDIAAAYGAGLAPRVWVDSTGTAEGLVALTAPLPDTRQTVRSRMSIAPWYKPDQWALVAGIGTSGSFLAELQAQTGLSFEQIDETAKTRTGYPQDALAAELTPARISKITFPSGLTNEQKVSAVYDRIINNFRQRALQILQFTEPPERLIITGGQALLPELSRRKSEALGSILTETRPKPEAAAFGAAMLTKLQIRSQKIS